MNSFSGFGLGLRKEHYADFLNQQALDSRATASSWRS